MSNLLDKASIILTPTAYNNGEALCVKPSDGSGDFDFSRNSAATRVNAQGLVENVQILSSNLVQNGDFSEEGVQEVSNGSFSQEGSELVTNGNFATDSDWAKGTGWSISGGAASCDGTQTSNSVLVSAANLSLGSGNLFKITFSVSNYISGSLDVVTLVGTGGPEFSGVNANGSYTAYSFGASTGDGKIQFIADSNFIGSIDNVSVREVGQNWALGTGWSIGEDKLNFTNVNGSSNQSGVFVIGKTYKITCDYVFTSGTRLILPYDGSNFNSDMRITTPSSAIGYTYYYTPLVGNALFTYSDGNGNGSITNISVKEVGQNWTIQSGTVNITDKAEFIGGGIIHQDALSVNTSYKVTYEVVSIVGVPVLNLYNGSWISAPSTVGTHTVYITMIAPRFYLRNLSNEITIDNISVIEITTDTSLPRINYEGFSYQDALGSELVTNGGFEDGLTDWTAYAGTISIETNIVHSGTQSAKVDGVGIQQSRSYTDGEQVYYNFWVYSTTGTSVFIQTINENVTIPLNQWVQVSGIGTINGNNSSFRIRIANGLWYIDNVSVKEYLGQEVVPDSGCGSWLWEPQTTQLVTYSELFSNAYWGNENVGTTPILETGFLAPDGTNNAFKISNANQNSFWYATTGGFNATTTRSIYARTVSGTGTAQLCSHNSNTNNTFTITEQWQRFELNATASAIGTDFFYAVDFRGSGTLSEIILWGANATNDQDYATSYIPTSGSTVTRNQDLCNNGGSLASINSTEGVLYAEIAALANDGTYRRIALSDNTSNNAIFIGYTATSNQIQCYITSSGVGEVSFLYILDNALDFNKIAIRYKDDDFSFWVDGVQVLTDTSGNAPIGLSELAFDRGSGSSEFYGKTKALAVWKEALSDQELTELTTI